MNIKELKKRILKETHNNPEKFFPVETLKEKGFSRKRCDCGRYFWSKNEEEKCGDCVPYSFIGKQQTKKKMNYIETAKAFSKHFDKLGYKSTERYPVVARWRKDLAFVHAAINNYQPHVTSGEVEPPANPLNVIQPSLRFNDIENVGITGRHFICHFHAEQFGVFEKEKYDKDKFLRDLIDVFENGLTLPVEDVKLHEDAWGGGGNLGVSLEHFLGGLELGNQVYMTEKTTEKGYKPLDVGVLDMGAGLERYAWMASDNPSIYDNTMPGVCKYLYKETGIEFDKDIINRFAPHGGQFNLDEVENVEKSWKEIAGKLSLDPEVLKEKIKPLAAIYSIADISRSLLFAINDGALPSNTGGNYNLRIIYRRALGFMDQYDWSFDFNKLFELHALHLKPLMKFENIKSVNEIIKVEEEKYKQSLAIANAKVKTLVKENSEFSIEKLKQLYESEGITPEMIKKAKPDVEMPDNFYSEFAESHEGIKKKTHEEYYEVDDVPETVPLWYEKELEFDANVLKVIKQDGKIFVILDKTAFYPNMGGQASDTGLIDKSRVKRVLKYKKRVLHEVENEVSGKVHGKVNKIRRMQLMKHHTGTHIINGAARQVLGEHIWQAGAEKTVEKARLDITHYESISKENLKKIENLANKIIMDKVPVDIQIYKKSEAEKQFRFKIYQGGAVPGNKVRVVNIKNFDVEACGGTHFDNTRDVELIKILNSKKIQDGVVRIEFVAGKDLAREAERKIKKQNAKKLSKWMEKIQALEDERLKLGGKPLILGVIPETEEGMLNLYKKINKDLHKLRTENIDSTEPVQFIDTPDMKLLQKTAQKILENHDYCFLVAPGMLYSYGEKTKKAVEKAAEIMGGKAGQKDKEFKGGGPKKDKSKEAFENGKELLN